MSEIAHSTGFSPEQYLEERDLRSDFVMVELGHGPSPVVHQQQNMLGGRAYVGIEAWMRDTTEVLREYKDRVLGDRALHNIFFVNQYRYPGVQHDRGPASEMEDLSPSYTAETILPDAAADELFMSNVTGDPFIAHEPNRTHAVLAEAARLVAPEGMVVIRETITPTYAQLDATALQRAGLELVHRQDQSDSAETWQALEARYNGARWRELGLGAFYLFLRKRQVRGESADPQ